eukprot:sb/3473293/
MSSDRELNKGPPERHARSYTTYISYQTLCTDRISPLYINLPACCTHVIISPILHNIFHITISLSISLSLSLSLSFDLLIYRSLYLSYPLSLFLNDRTPYLSLLLSADISTSFLSSIPHTPTNPLEFRTKPINLQPAQISNKAQSQYGAQITKS